MTHLVQLSLGPQVAQLHDALTGGLIGHIEAGYQLMTAQHFRRHPLDPGALERAIEWTEDRIQMARLSLPAGSRLSTRDADVRQLAQIAGVDAGTPELHRDAVEQVFSRLVLQAFGQAAQQETLPDSTRVFATVVLLREMLHHLGFEAIHIEGADTTP
jgi:hypothetical protein